MSIYLQSTPSLRSKRMTKNQRKLLTEENERRRKRGEAPLETLRFEKLDKDKVRNKNNFPNYKWTPRQDETKKIPSHNSHHCQNGTTRSTMMDKVLSGEISGKEAQEIIRKSKCLAPAFNKGAYQYIGGDDAARDAGKKNSE